MYSSKQIANYFLYKNGTSSDITPMKLTKLVYIAHGWYLGLTGEVLIDENPEAWKYGPVIPSIYHEYKSYRNRPIKKVFSEKVSLGNEGVEQFLNKIWEVYGLYSAIELSAKTHEDGTPWSKVWNSIRDGNYFSLQIPEMEIKNYYQKLLKMNQPEIAAEYE